MTREEAIQRLKEFIILHQEQHGWDVSTIKALDKAIKALEQEPCEDVIHRDRTVQDFADKCRECGKQKKGKWIAKSFHEVYCDNCKFDFDIMTNEFIDKMKYCPNCGAEMAESEE